MTVPPRLAMRGVTKVFGATQALAGVDLTVRAGEIHALIGENGAGKSTLMNVLAGVLAPDAGTIAIDGRPFTAKNPLSARAVGVAMIHQELALCSHLDVTQNVFLGFESKKHGFLDRAAMRAKTVSLLERLGLAGLEPDTRVGALPPGVRQIVEIARALAFQARIVIMDEPTSSLGPTEVDRLFAIARELAREGTSIVLISHSFREVRAVAQRCTILRDGATVMACALEEIDDEGIALAMAGRGLASRGARSTRPRGEPLLTLTELAGARLPHRASLTLHRGEVVGIFGMGGAGRTELLRVVFGLDPVRAGTISVGSNVDRGASPRSRLASRVGFVSEDRKQEGLALRLSVAENLTLTRLLPFSKGGWLSLAARDAAARRWMAELSVRASSERQPVAELSGGNQQKIAIVRLLHHECDVLLLDEPTRGIDVGGRAAIERLILVQRDAGKAILVVSSYIPELLALCDRIAVMHRGVLGEARPAEEWDEARLLASAAVGSTG